MTVDIDRPPGREGALRADLPEEVKSLVDLLRLRAGERGEQVAYTFLADGEEEAERLTFAELDRRAREIGAALQRTGGAAIEGRPVLLLYPPGLEFVAGFFGCLYAGAVAVPAYPPRSKRSLPRLRSMAKDAEPAVALTTSELAPRIESLAAGVPELADLPTLATDALGSNLEAGLEVTAGCDPALRADRVRRAGSHPAAEERWRDPGAGPETLAFLQYTSGSTAAPKGVMVTHGNLLHNEEAIRRGFGQSEASVIVGWLPLYHDMGLIGNVLQPLYLGARCILMSPVAFLQKPVRWLRAVSRYRATTSGGPSFSYDLVARKSRPEDLAGVDLSSWTVAFNGAEPVRAATLDRFAEAFAPYGFRREAFYPCYGLAEATLFVTGGAPGEMPVVAEYDPSALERGEAREAADGAEEARRLVSSGRAQGGQEVRVVDPETRRPVADGAVGEIWVRGPSVTGGYWRRPQATAEDFGAELSGVAEEERGPYLRTGDLGFLAGGELFVTGRRKDLIILRGRNLYPQDLELTAERAHPALRPGCGAAFSVEVPTDGGDGIEERLAIVHEVHRHDHDGDHAAMADAIRAAVAEEHDAPVDTVVLIRHGTILKTSSGKIRRSACRQAMLAGELAELARSGPGGERGERAEPGAAFPSRDQLLGLASGERRALLAAALRDQLARALGVAAERIEASEPVLLDSLAAMELKGRVDAALDLDLPLAGIIEGPTLEGLTETLLVALAGGTGADPEGAAEGAGARPRTIPRLPRSGGTDRFPTSSAQERMWFLEHLEPGSATYNVPGALELTGRLRLPALAGALDQATRRHESLRTTFEVEGNRPVQVVAPPARAISRLPVVDLRGLRPGPRRRQADRLVLAEARRPFDLVRGPLIRTLLLRLADDQHTLLVTLHHIVSDGWSLGVFVQDLSTLYRAALGTDEARLPDLPVQYADFAAWQRSRLDGPELEQQLAYWRERLAEEPPLLELPTDRPRPAVRTFRGAQRRVVLDPAVTRGLEELAVRERATRFMVVLSAFYVLLHRLTGQDDLVVGSAIAGRGQRETEGVVGCFLNTLALRTRLDGPRLGFREVVRRVRETALEGYAHADLPFERLVSEVAPRRSRSHTALFQVLLVEHNGPLEPGDLPDLEARVHEPETGTSKFDLVLTLAEVGPAGARRLDGWLRYSSDLFDGTTIRRLTERFDVLARALLAEPDRPVASLPWSTRAERQQLLEWNDTAAVDAGAPTLHARIGDRARRTPDRIAVVAGAEALSYRELLRRARVLAARLRALGVEPETRVGVFVERSTELLVALLGVLEAGGAYVPIDPSYPAERVRFVLEDAGVPVLIVQRGLEGSVPVLEARVLALDAGAPGAEVSGATGRPTDGAAGDRLAYVIYTSGSTGRPKGAMNSHRAIVNRLVWMQERYRLDGSDRVLQKTPTSFDVSVWELFWPLLAGGTSVMARPGGHKDPAYLVRAIEDHRVTTLHFVPSMLRAFLESPGLEACRDVRRVIASGEALVRDLEQSFFERMPPGVRLENLYGPTEAAVDVTWWPCAPRSDAAPVPIGRPVANTAIHVLDRACAPVPPGVHGELHIGGVQVARGYLGRPALTAERFLPDACSGRPGARLYRTGDLARWRGDGALDYLGRTDHQVKVRGFRIELGEIEAALAELPGVIEAAVLAPSSGPNDERRLVAYVVAPGAEPDGAGLRGALAARLPEHMVPSSLVFLESLPTSPNGKVDRAALKRIEAQAPAAGAVVEPPESPTERGVAALWREVLGVDAVGRHDSFFEIGGDSIRGAVVTNRLQALLGEIVHVVALFDHPTVAELAAYLERDYPQAVARVWGGGRQPTADLAPAEEGPVDEARISLLRRIVDEYAVDADPSPARLPRAVFLLSPPRSGSTLLRAMLAGHPRLFAPPELELLTFARMDERAAAFSGRESFWQEGLVRAVMATHRCGAERARAVLAACEAAGSSTDDVYRELQERLGGRLLVDKTPSYALYRSVLARAEALFDRPLYVELVRHPCGMIRSFEEARLEQVFFRHQHRFSRRELAELVWVVSHRNVAERTGLLPRERCHRLRFEDLVREPEREMERLCRFLGVELDPAVLDPYDDAESRMTDGVHEESRMLGDVKFHRHRRVDPAAADRWRESHSPEDLGEPTRELAAALGYPMERRRAGRGAAVDLRAPRLRRRFSTAPGTELPLSFAQERLWFLERLDPGLGAYNMPAALRLRGALDLDALRRSFAEVVRRHVVLRSRFEERRGEPVQVVEVPPRWRLPVVDLQGLRASRRRRETEALARCEARRPFDLAEPPFLRTVLVRTAPTDHALLVTLHHIASDGWSVGVLAREVAILYPAMAEREPAAVAPLPLQYADYAAWHREWVSGERLEEQLSRWRQRLAGAPQLLQVPADRPRPPRPSHLGGTRRRLLGNGLAQRLEALGHDRGGTLFTVLLAGLGALLGRLSGQDDLLIGTPVANRGRLEIEGLVGFFVNTLALRTDLSGDPPFDRVVDRAREVSLAAFGDQDLPWEKVVEELRPDRGGNHPAVVQVMLVLQNAPASLELPGATLEPIELDTGTARFDLTFVVTAEPRGLSVALDYDRELFDAVTAQRLLGHLHVLLEAAAEDPGLRVSRLPLLGRAERVQLVDEWNDTVRPERGLPAGLPSLPGAVARWVDRTPDAVAVAFGAGRREVRWSYRGLWERAGRLARRLASLGVGPDVLVGLSVERSPELVLGVLGVLRAGGAWLPLDSSYPPERLQLMVDDAAPQVLLTRESLLGALPESSAEVVLLDDLDGLPAASPGTAVDPTVRPENLAYVIYTSGSTGRPKGVALSHRGLANLCAAQAVSFGPGPGDRVVQFAPASFDASVFELAMALASGGQVDLADADSLLPGEPLARLLRERRITNATVPPSALAALPPSERAELPALATVIVAGEACPPELARSWGEGGRRSFWNAYGPTETTVWATAERWTDPDAAITIGRPITNARVHLLDAAGMAVPPGVPGELHIGGPGLARGYLRRPALTAERFVPDPFARGEGGARLYRTGDLARYLPDGRIDFLGRVDHQVKVRGFRIELGEIEAVLTGHPEVAEAVVLPREGGSAEPLLVGLAGYVLVRGATSEDRLRRELVAHLSQRLPAYMVPSGLRLLADFPRTPAGKVDRRALAALGVAAEGQHVEPPEGPVEELLAGLWAELLELPAGSVSRHASFFELGGHSLLATRVTARVRDDLGVELPIRRLFERPTVAGLAAEIEALSTGVRDAEGPQGPPERTGPAAFRAPPLVPVERDGPPPLSFAQERLWFLDRLQPGNATYNIPVAVRLVGDLHLPAFRGALADIVARHETLRTTFATGSGSGGPVQVIAPAAPPPVPVVDLSRIGASGPAAGAARREAEARRLVREEARIPFDLAAGPLLRATVVRLGVGPAGVAGDTEHLLLLDMHHAVSDGWSVGVLIRELSAFYGARLEGASADLPALPSLPIQYADYAVWQREWLAGEVLAAQIAYWREALAGLPDLLELPTDRPRPPVQRFEGGAVPVELGAELTAVLDRFARGREATPFMVLLAAFHALLGRYAGQDDLAVGSPVANRTHAATEGLIGFFVNTLVLRGDLSGDPSFDELVERARETALAAYAHQDLPFEKLVEELRPGRSLGHAPLFQTMLVLQNAPFEPLELPGLTLEPLAADHPAAKFDLTLNLREGGEGLEGRFEYRRDLFDRTTAERMTEHLRILLEGALGAPDTRLSELPWLTAPERRQLRAWSEPGGAFPEERTIHELFAERAAVRPDAVAVVSGGTHVSYGELGRRARGLAARLRALGVGPESLVGLSVDRDYPMILGILGILEAGGAYVPFDPSYPPERVAFMVEDAGASVVLTEAERAGSLEVGDARVVAIDALALEPPAVAPDPPAPSDAERADRLAYVIYTSGSTGRPKGTGITHRAVTRLLGGTDPWYGFGPDDAWTLFHSYAFDFSVWEIWGALLYGGRLVLVPYWVSRSPDDFRDLLARERITVLNQTPSAFRQLVHREEERAAPASGADELALRYVVFGGEALDPQALAPWVERHGWDRPLLVNMYGITETTVHVTYRPLGERDLAVAGRSPVGVPIPDLQLHVVDPHLRRVPMGVPGELLVGGPGLARGYLGRPALTAQRFVPNPFARVDAVPGSSAEPGSRLYRAGDLARRLADGELDFLGRIDHQVKIRGFRIELGEIEAALAAHPAVRDAVVLSWQEGGASPRLAAWVVPAGGGEGDPPEAGALREHLSDHLAETLPDHMIPAVFTFLDELPLTPTGKLDRRALPAPSWSGGAEEGYTAPRGPLEELIADLWARVLGVERVGAHDDFFQLGGHSLLAARLMARLRDAVGFELPLVKLFESPTVAGLARELEAQSGEGAEGAGAGPRPVPRQADGARLPLSPIPLSPAQERLWFLDRLAPGSPWYNIPAALRLRGALDPPALARTLAAVVRRHEALRTTLAETGDGPVQVIRPAAEVDPGSAVVDLSGLPGVEIREAEVRRLAGAEARRPFDLERGPLFRRALVRLADDDHALLATFHHTVADGASLAVFLSELATLYARESGAADAAGVPDLPVQYADYAVWQRERLAGGVLERQLGWWRERLAAVPPVLELPTDRPRPAVQGLRGGHAPFRLDAATVDGLSRLGRERGATLFMTLLAVFAAWLVRHGAGRDLVVGSPVAGRDRSEVDDLIGLFVNLLPLRLDLPAAPSVADLLTVARRSVLGAHAHREVPFEKLVEELKLVRDPSHPPLVQAVLLLDQTTAPPTLPGLSVETMAIESGTAKFDLNLSLRSVGSAEVGAEDGLAGVLEYDRDLFDPTTAARMAERFVRLAEGVVAAADDPEGLRLRELPLLSPAERHQLTVEWNATETDYPRERLLHELVREQSERRPERVALVAGAEHVTYGELVRRADRLAVRLRGLDVGPETRVGLALDRSPLLVEAVLGILVAGGAYVPLDAGYPRERLRYLVEDSGVEVLVTSEHLLEALPADDLVERGAVALLDGTRCDGDDPEMPPTDPSASPDRTAYVIYTSGSTGKPKGVVIPHRGAIRLVHEPSYLRLADPRGTGSDETGLLLATISFDATTFEIWFPLLAGGRLALMPREKPSLAEVAHEIGRQRVTTLFVTTALYHQLVDEHLGDLVTLRSLLAGGEALSPSHVRRTVEELPGTLMIDVYGPTENSAYTSAYPVNPGLTPPDRFPDPVPIGRPIGDTTVHVVDPTLRPAGVGVPGELVTGGDGVASGYAGRPALTAERFVPDPFADLADPPRPGARLYRTGDLARWLPSGDVEFLGRLDHQVKIRGFRVEPGEIEAALGEIDGVGAAVVLVHDDLPGGKAAVAYVVPEAGGAAPEPAALREALRSRLPEFMCPSFFVPVDELPLNANGKVDRRVLAALGAERIAERLAGEGAAAAKMAPRTPIERELAAIWEGVLGVADIGVEDDFFELGGHSLLATRLVSRIRAAFGVELPLRALFERPTVGELARRIAEAGADAAEAPPLEPLPAERRAAGDLPLSFSQQRLWFLERLEPGSALYAVPAAFRAEGPLRPARLARALDAVVARHEALRTTFPESAAQGGEPVQRIAPPPPEGPGVPLPVVDLSALPEARRAPVARALAGAEARRPFDLAAGPLLRALLVRSAPDDHLFFVDQHHIVSDGWSLGVFVAELAAAYGDGTEGATEALPPLPVQYADYAAWQRGWLTGEALDRRLAFWRGHLGGVPPIELPTDRPRPPLQTFRGGARRATLPPELAAAVRGFARGRDATLFMVLLAGFEALLGRTAGQDEFAVGTPVAGRDRRELEGLIGFFVNTLALRADLGGEPSFADLLARVRDGALDAFAHQELPFERVVDELVPERDLARPPIFQVAFALQEAPPVPSLAGLALEPVGLGRELARFELGMTAFDRGDDGIEISIGFNTDLFDGTRIERMLGHLRHLLATAAADPERSIRTLPLLGAAERHQLLAEWNDPAVGLPLARSEGGPSPSELFAAAAQRAPDAIALVDESGALTFRALDRRVESLARKLRAAGAGAEVVVGVSIARSFDLVTALLAVLRAGGAYLPLDPSYPSDRLRFMAEDSGLRVLLADERSAAELPLGGDGVARLVLERLSHVSAGDDSRREAFRDPGPDGAAYVIYTSGSTGEPKGVVGTRRAMGNLLRDRRVATVGPSDRVLHKTPVSFDASIFEIFSPLVAGATAVLARPGGEKDAAYLVRRIAEERVTVAGSTPSMLATLLDQPGIEACRTLRRMATGSEAVPPDLAQRYHAFGLSDLFNLYGPTETTVAVLEHPSRQRLHERAGDGEGPRTLPIGRPMAGARIYLLDAAGEPVPAGVPGEIAIGGPSLARGYLGRPAATAERYRPDPFAGRQLAREGGARLYRTGDLARQRPDGAVEFLGRIDRQVKVRGFRIELAEVERALTERPGVLEAAAVTQEMGGEATRRLVAYLVPESGGSLDTDALRDLLAERVPEFMVPSAFVVLDALPLTPSEKVDRRALEARAAEEAAAALAGAGGSAAEQVPPRDELERELCAIWRDLLGVERVGVTDDFFRLGGHSLLAVRLVSRVGEAIGRELPLATLFQAPTVEKLARLVRGGAAAQRPGVLVPLHEPARQSAEPPLFLVHAVGGAVFSYRSLAEALAAAGPAPPVYGLQARGLLSGQEPHETVEEMAEDYVEALVEARPHGPYRLGGWSFGALVAHEMARRLTVRGETVELLALIDPTAPGEGDPGEVSDLDLLRLLMRDLVSLSGARTSVPLDELERELGDEVEAALAEGGWEAGLERTIDRAGEAGALPEHESPESLRRIASVHRANVLAAARYRPGTGTGTGAGAAPALALCAVESPAAEGLGRWREVLGGDVEARHLPGDHYSLLRPPRVAALAEAIADRLRRGDDEWAERRGEERAEAAAE